MNTLEISAIEMRENEMLIVAFMGGEWWATIGPDNSPNSRAIGSGTTPVNALCEMLVHLGHTPAVTQ